MIKINVVAIGDIKEKYLLDAESHISMAKTILYGQTPHYLYSFFECMAISNQQQSIHTADVNNV